MKADVLPPDSNRSRFYSGGATRGESEPLSHLRGGHGARGITSVRTSSCCARHPRTHMPSFSTIEA